MSSKAKGFTIILTHTHLARFILSPYCFRDCMHSALDQTHILRCRVVPHCTSYSCHDSCTVLLVTSTSNVGCTIHSDVCSDLEIKFSIHSAYPMAAMSTVTLGDAMHERHDLATWCFRLHRDCASSTCHADSTDQCSYLSWLVSFVSGAVKAGPTSMASCVVDGDLAGHRPARVTKFFKQRTLRCRDHAD